VLVSESGEQRGKTFRAKEIDSLVRVELPVGIELTNDSRRGVIK
jgi:hypothetical protein